MKIGAIVNPNAGGWKRIAIPEARQDRLAAVERWLDPTGSRRIPMWETRQPEDGARFAREAQEIGCETLVAVGGDGTLHAVLQGLTDDRMRLGLIPMGTANVLARILKIPLHNPAQAGQIVCEGVERRLDLGALGARRFALVAGLGFDGAVVRAVPAASKRRLGVWAYVLAALRQSRLYPSTPITLTLDAGSAQTFDAYQVLIANGELYGGRFRLGPTVRPDDGLLDVFVFLRRHSLRRDLAGHALALALGRLPRASGVCCYQARQIAFHAPSPLPLELDGDAIDAPSAIFTIQPAALRFLTPPA